MSEQESIKERFLDVSEGREGGAAAQGGSEPMMDRQNELKEDEQTYQPQPSSGESDLQKKVGEAESKGANPGDNVFDS